jgi:hypothetical protein
MKYIDNSVVCLEPLKENVALSYFFAWRCRTLMCRTLCSCWIGYIVPVADCKLAPSRQQYRYLYGRYVEQQILLAYLLLRSYSHPMYSHEKYRVHNFIVVSA